MTTLFRIENLKIDLCGMVSNVESTKTPLPNKTPIKTLVGEYTTAPSRIVFADASKRPKPFEITGKINYNAVTTHSGVRYCCHFCTLPLKDGCLPIGMPVSFTYPSVEKIIPTAKDKICIRESVASSDEKIGTYNVEGIYCSWNCMLAQAYSEVPKVMNPKMPLIARYYRDMMRGASGTNTTPDEVTEIRPSPSRLFLECYGGHLTPDEYQMSFNFRHFEHKGRFPVYGDGVLYSVDYSVR